VGVVLIDRSSTAYYAGIAKEAYTKLTLCSMFW